MTRDRDRRARPGAVLTVGVTALLTGAGIGLFAHTVTTYLKQSCAAETAKYPESMCGLGVIFWGPAVVVVTALFAGFVMWPVLAIAGIEPRRRVLVGAFLVPVVLVEPFGAAASAHAPPVLVTALAFGVVQAWIAFAGGARLTHR
ncbi:MULTISPECIES: hypothetical protein [Amycolatopsis]|uniref:hypothetical protein n=1 Tax=Amycolatopsis TaxID=1813 RepID=UPI00174B786A|nr:hypothetical protein [Amycolatopsis bullii]